MKLHRFFLLIALMAIFSPAWAWEKKQAPIMTTWGENLTPDNVWQSYPRPQLKRADWVNLNGVWKYGKIKGTTSHRYVKPTSSYFSGEILVPFPVESALSGVMDTNFEENSRALFIYNRTFTVPSAYRSKRTLLHFGSVDWSCTVYVNGKEVGKHTGLSDPFAFDITDYLIEGDEQELMVCVTDPSNHGGQPCGKQIVNPGGIMYTPASGIIQTVWMEPVDATHITRYEVIPNIDANTVDIKVVSATEGATATISIKDGTNTITTEQGVPVGTYCTLSVPNAKLWSPDSPFLYDLSITLADASGNTTDEVKGYMGMRKFSRGRVLGKPCILLNNKPLYLYGPLDQGYWPDGIYTPPSEEAMFFDLQTMKDLGMNMVRKHIKVECDQWFEWCDRNGLVVWQDMPSGSTGKSDLGDEEWHRNNFYDECTRIVNYYKQHPSIGAWIPFNESWGQDLGNGSRHTIKGTETVRKADEDPYRLINSVTGWNDFGVGDFMDIHSYPAPGASENPENRRINSCGEFGGITYMIEGHLWAGSQMEYTSVKTAEEYRRMYNQFTQRLQELQHTRGLWSSVYTQISDVEQELNGILTYDRKVLKVNDEQKESMRRLIDQTIHYRYLGTKHLTPTAESSSEAKWRYTTSKPSGNWWEPSYNDGAWNEGVAGFGAGNPPNSITRTTWNTGDIYLRRTFSLDGVSEKDLEQATLRIYYDEDVEVYINNIKAFTATGYVTSYINADISAEVRASLKKEGNVIAIHCHQTGGGQYIDAGLSVEQYIPNNELDPLPSAEGTGQVLPAMAPVSGKAYLMAYQRESTKRLHYAYSTDGSEWVNLNSGDPIYLGNYSRAKSVYNPYLKAITIDGVTTYHLMYDLNNRNIFHLESSDLVHWTGVDGGNGAIEVMNDERGPKATAAATPQFYYDSIRNRFYIYWCSKVDGYYKAYIMNTRNWKTFSNVTELMNTGKDVRDLAFTPADGTLYVHYSDGENGNRIVVQNTDNIANNPVNFKNKKLLFPSTRLGIFAPSVYEALGGDGYFIYTNEKENGKNSLMFATASLALGCWEQLPADAVTLPADDMVSCSVITIDSATLEALKQADFSDVKDIKASAKSLAFNSATCTISVPEIAKDAKLTIFDATGKTVGTFTPDANGNVNCNKLPSSTYIAQYHKLPALKFTK